jgi:hypothetical protein
LVVEAMLVRVLAAAAAAQLMFVKAARVWVSELSLPVVVAVPETGTMVVPEEALLEVSATHPVETTVVVAPRALVATAEPAAEPADLEV